MKKVSIIIPNYNNERFVGQCLESVARQTYTNKEVIVIDDGSTDESPLIVRNFISKNKKINAKLICQSNMNASIARNRGLGVATGDYVLFLDSDDYLEDDALSVLVNAAEKNNADLVIGNHDKIDEDGKKIGHLEYVHKNALVNARESFDRLADFGPVPSNKLYSMKVMKDNGVWWENVRIGQDLNFYLKYLGVCKKVALVNKCIYKYRINSKSMTRTYDYRIFDIVNGFSSVKKFYDAHGGTVFYNEHLPVVALKHYNCQLSKQRFYEDRKTRRMVVDFFSISEKKLDYSHCKKNDSFKRLYRKYRLLCLLKYIITTNVYCRYLARKNGE